MLLSEILYLSWILGHAFFYLVLHFVCVKLDIVKFPLERVDEFSLLGIFDHDLLVLMFQFFDGESGLIQIILELVCKVIELRELFEMDVDLSLHIVKKLAWVSDLVTLDLIVT